MPNSVHRVEILPERVKRTIYNKLKNLAFRYDGIIFGGMVRDEIISDHYKAMYYADLKDQFDSKKFWNPSHHPQTSSRTLNPEDMDISFARSEDADDFIDAVVTMIKEDLGSDTDYTLNEIINQNTQYSMFALKSVRRLAFDVYLGKIPLYFSGHKISISIDIVMPENSNLLPPFKSLDMLCNAFIMTKYGKILSNHTGTPLDRLSDMQRMKASASIMQDIVNFTTDFTLGIKLMSNVGSFKYNKYAYKRIDKMLSKSPTWTIRDLPFDITKVAQEDKEHECCICSNHFLKNSRKITFHIQKQDEETNEVKKIQSSILHEGCLMKYIEHQIQDRELHHPDEEYDEFVFKCPFRNPINFLSSTRSIKGKIAEMSH
jgi:hypothetical protein